MEERDEIDLANLSYFLDSSSGDDDDGITDNRQQKGLMEKKIAEVTKLQIETKLSYSATSKVLKIMNKMPNTSIQLPTDPKSIRNITSSSLQSICLIKCETCNDLVEHNKKCTQCDRILKKDSKKNNFLVYISLEQQIRQIINRHFDQIITYLNREHVHNTMCDIDDGLLYKQLLEKYPHVKIISMTLNVDGDVPLHCSVYYFIIDVLPLG